MTNKEKYIDNASDKTAAENLENVLWHYYAKKKGGDFKEVLYDWLSQEVEEDNGRERISCNVCKYAISNGYCSSFMHHHICMNPKSARYNKGVDVVNDGCDKGEVEEDIVNIPSTGKMPKTDKTTFDYEKPEIMQPTKKAYYSILVRLDNLEKCNRITEVKEHIEERLKEKTKDMVKNKNMRPMTKEDVEELIDKIGRCSEEVKKMNKTADEMFEELGYYKIENSFLSDHEKKQKIQKLAEYRQMKSEERWHITIYTNDKNELLFNKTNCEPITEAEDKAIHKKIEELRNGN